MNITKAELKDLLKDNLRIESSLDFGYEDDDRIRIYFTTELIYDGEVIDIFESNVSFVAGG